MKGFFFNVTPQDPSGFSLHYSIGGENEFNQTCETAEEAAAALEQWATNVPQGSPRK